MRVVEVGQYFVTRDTGVFRQFQTVACREYTLPRDDQASHPKGWIQGNMRIGLVLEVTTSFQHFKYGIEIRIKSVNQDDSHSWSWVRNFLPNGQICERFYWRRHRKSSRFTRRGKCTNKIKCGCSQVKGKSKTSTEGTNWHDNYTTKWKNMDWYWTIKARSRVVQSLEESDQSSSTTRSYIEKKMEQLNSARQSFIFEIIIHKYRIGLMIHGNLFRCRRRIQTKISVLLWLFGINNLSPCSSRTFWEQSHWSYTTGQCVDWTWNIPLHPPCGK